MTLLFESTRKAVCRLAFVVGCLVPTCWTAGWCAWRNLPGEAGRWSQWLSDRWHLQISISQVEYPRPGELRLRGIHVREGAAGEVALEIPEVSLRQRRDRRRNISWIDVELPGATLVARQFPSLMRALMLYMEEQDPRQSPRWAVTRGIDAVTIVRRRGPAMTGAVHSLQSGHLAEGTTVTARFSPRGGESRAAIVFAGQWRATPSQATWMARIAAQETPIPGWWCQGWNDALSAGLAGAEFHGEIHASGAGLKARIDRLAGILQKIDVGALFGDQFAPHRLAGTAALRLADARLNDGQLTYARGTLTIREGAASTSLLESARTVLGWSLNPNVPLQGGTVAFDRLDMAFEIAKGMLSTRGLIDSLDHREGGYVLQAGSTELAWIPADHTVPAVALADVLAHPAAPRARISPRTRRLLHMLLVSGDSAPRQVGLEGKALASWDDATSQPGTR